MTALAKADEWGLECCQYATDVLKASGFALSYTSMSSESCYYRHPSVPSNGVLRVSTHGYGGRTDAKWSGNPVLARITFGSHIRPKSFEGLDTIIAIGVGRYFLNACKVET